MNTVVGKLVISTVEAREEKDCDVYSTWNQANTPSLCSRTTKTVSFAEPILVSNQRMLSQKEGFRVAIRSYQFLSPIIRRLPNEDIGPSTTT